MWGHLPSVAMALPPLYVQNLELKAGDRPQLWAYKLGLVEHVLKEALRLIDDGESTEVVRERVRTALDVALWEPRGAGGGS